MARVTTYLNFVGTTEAAFEFYRQVFGTEFSHPVTRFGGALGPDATEADRALVMHVELPILAGHVLMGTDVVASMGHRLAIGDNVSINLEPDSREEADRLYAALAEGGEGSGLADMPWGAYWGTLKDRFGTRWMFHVLAA